MKCILLIAALLAALPYPALSEAEWTYITDQDDGALWFGGNIRKYGDKTFIDLHTQEHPEGDNGPKDKFVVSFDCNNKTVKWDANEYIAVDKNTVESKIYNFACK